MKNVNLETHNLHNATILPNVAETLQYSIPVSALYRGGGSVSGADSVQSVGANTGSHSGSIAVAPAHCQISHSFIVI